MSPIARPRRRPFGRPVAPLAVAAALVSTLGVPPGAAASEGSPATQPRLLSPSGTWDSPALAQSCPTFSWAELSTAPGYELVVFRAAAGVDSRDAAAPESDPQLEVVLRRRLPAGSSSWTPDLRACLAAGGRYAWSVRSIDEHAVAEDGLGAAWAEPAWLEVSAEPSAEEVSHALDVLRRYAAARGEAPPAPEQEGSGPTLDLLRSAPAGRQRVADSHGDGLAGAEAGIPGRVASPSSTPVLGPASLSVSQQIHLADESAMFKNGDLFLWDQDVGFNLALGRRALASNQQTGQNFEGMSNTAVGFEALTSNATGSRNTSIGSQALAANEDGSYNTAVGFGSLDANTHGGLNTALGHRALHSSQTGNGNTAIGEHSLPANESGMGNTALGQSAGHLTTGDFNILINSWGAALESNVLRIGDDTGLGYRAVNQVYIQGISGRAVSVGPGAGVFVGTDGKLGTRTCGATYVAAATCPVGNADGPTCDEIPAGSYCEADGECSIADLNNCAGFDWYLRIE